MSRSASDAIRHALARELVLHAAHRVRRPLVAAEDPAEDDRHGEEVDGEIAHQRQPHAPAAHCCWAESKIAGRSPWLDIATSTRDEEQHAEDKRRRS